MNLERAPMLIGGELTGSECGEWLPSVDPADESLLGHVPQGTAGDVARAVEAAEKAAPAWAELPMSERASYLRKVARRLSERAEELLDLEVADTGNTITKMARDVSSAVEAIEYYAGIGLELKGETIPATSKNLHFTLREPYGVVARIVPFNHPIKFASAALAAPMMAGNCVLVKPPEQSSLSATILAEICQQELPPGVANIVTGLGPVVGDAIVRHPSIKRIAFTGSVPTGLAIQRAAAATAVKTVTLELGGKNPMIIFPDIDPDEAANAAVAGMNFAWQGQSCGSTSRLLVHESIYDNVLTRVLERVAAIRLGMPKDPASEMGPINSAAQYERVKRYIEFAKADGANLRIGGKRPNGSMFERGYWIEPTVYSQIDMSMRIAKEEVFGPILSVAKWRDADDAIRIANSTEYGLTASIWTRDLKLALRTARSVKSGYIWINGFSNHYLGTPFGGFKNSGVGREEGIDELLGYTETKTIHVML